MRGLVAWSTPRHARHAQSKEQHRQKAKASTCGAASAQPTAQAVRCEGTMEQHNRGIDTGSSSVVMRAVEGETLRAAMEESLAVTAGETTSAATATIRQAVDAEGDNARKRSRGRPKRNGEAAIEWTDELTQMLLKLRFEKYGKRFENQRNTGGIHRVWIAIGTDLGRSFSIPIGAEQCRNKVKSLRSKWVAYWADMSKTGNDVASQCPQPQCFDAMMDVWGDKRGLGGATLHDEFLTVVPSGDDGGASDSDEEEMVPRPRGTKKQARTSIGQAVESGLFEVAESFRSLAGNLIGERNSNESAGSSVNIEQSVNELKAVTLALADSIKVQTASIVELIRCIRSEREGSQ